MAHVTPADIPLPAFVDPLLDYISESLPGPVYSFIVAFASRCLAVISALLTLFGAILQTHPSEWSAQTLLPPLIAFLAAYFALVSLYRTTSWMLRTSIWFIKWGTILGIFVGGAGWLMGAGNTVGAPAVASVLGGFVLDMINGEGGARGNSRSTRGRASSKTRTRPKARDKFQKHREWQYEESSAPQEVDVQAVLEDILGTARNSGFWNAMKSAVQGFQGGEEETRSRKDAKAGGTTSR
ncbi:hypothetical protein E1B28_009956 [Marasmius oreades]|uniref:Uncharacterized protein n=1 Tax=Marasmius oreades TaxID=181124 RepID=A0A9P7URA1_9AGAR|nr:uncharacterized protein E1B28_009956 [Marasmius oreades]KAG7090875.1 hypothetical protein E1B28_009956 [Marasmius oreades]